MKQKKARKALVKASRYFHQRQWALATSSNFSAKLGDNRILITISGKNKERLRPSDLMIVDQKGRALKPENAKSSAETELHLHLYQRFSGVECVLHVHSPYATVLSMLQKDIIIDNFEMAKAFKGVSTHEHNEVVPVVPNSQNMTDIINAIEKKISDKTHAYAIAGHGFYTWAESIEQAIYQVEAFEFLFHCQYRLNQLGIKG